MSVLVVELDDARSNSIVAALGAGASAAQSVRSVAADLTRTAAMVVVIGPSVADDVAVAITAAVKASNPLAQTIWMRPRLDTQVVLAAVADGASYVVPADALEELVHAVARHLASAHQAAIATGALANPDLGPAVAMFSPKGGVGKTTLATSLAAQLAAERGIRVALVDLDLEFGDAQIHFAVELKHSIAELDAASIDDAALRAAMLHHESGVQILAAPPTPELAEQVGIELVADVICRARRLYDLVIVDCPPTLNEHVLAAFDSCTQIAVVTTPDVAALKNVASSLRAISRVGSPAQIHLVLNMARDDVECSAQDMEEVLAASRLPYVVSASIPVEPAVQAATNRGETFVLQHPQSAMSSALRSWAVTNLPLSVSVDVSEPKKRRISLRPRSKVAVA